MSNKKEQLLKILQRSNKPITGKELARQLDVSTRTIINYINRLNNDSKESFILSGQDGYYINRSAMYEAEEDEIPQERNQRLYYLLKDLLLSGEEGHDSFDLADEMFISYSLLRKEIADFNNILKPYEVSIVSRNNQLMIEGTETAKRRVMTAFIQKNQGENILNDEKLKTYFTEDIVQPINEIVVRNIESAGAYINEFSRLNLLLHLSIMANRLIIGKELQDAGESANRREESVASDIISEVEQKFDIKLNNTEYAQMSSLIRSHIHLDSNESGAISEDKNSELFHFLSETMNQVRNRYYLDFTNEQFLLPFSLHVENLLMRLEKNILIDNPIKESFRSSTPFLYDVALFIINEVKKHYSANGNVSDNELTFLVMHLALELERQKQSSSSVKCLLFLPKYLGIETNLANKIRVHFEDMIDITGIIYSEEEIKKYEYDVLISFVNISVPMTKKYIHISPLMTQHDYTVMNEAITALQQEKQLLGFKNVFPLFFREENFTVTHEQMDKYDAIHILSEMLESNECVKGDFEAVARQREDAISTGYINFAVPHGVSPDVLEQSVAVMIAPDGIRWGDRTVYCVMLMAVNPEGLDEFQDMYNALLLLLMETDCVENLRTIHDFEQFQNVVLKTKL